jgi:hypothetical protein
MKLTTRKIMAKAAIVQLQDPRRKGEEAAKAWTRSSHALTKDAGRATHELSIFTDTN